MDSPIYGDENSTKQKILYYSFAAFITILAAVSIALLITYTFLSNGQWPHILFAATILAIMIPGVIMLVFHKRDDGTMDSKLKIVTVSIWLVVVFACVVGICYVFGVTFPGEKEMNACRKRGYASGHENSKTYGFMYRFSDYKCFDPVPCMSLPNSCVVWDNSGMPMCGIFNFTSSICSNISPVLY